MAAIEAETSPLTNFFTFVQSSVHDEEVLNLQSDGGVEAKLFQGRIMVFKAPKE